MRWAILRTWVTTAHLQDQRTLLTGGRLSALPQEALVQRQAQSHVGRRRLRKLVRQLPRCHCRRLLQDTLSLSDSPISRGFLSPVSHHKLHAERKYEIVEGFDCCMRLHLHLH